MRARRSSREIEGCGPGATWQNGRPDENRSLQPNRMDGGGLRRRVGAAAVRGDAPAGMDGRDVDRAGAAARHGPAGARAPGVENGRILRAAVLAPERSVPDARVRGRMAVPERLLRAVFPADGLAGEPLARRGGGVCGLGGGGLVRERISARLDLRRVPGQYAGGGAGALAGGDPTRGIRRRVAGLGPGGLRQRPAGVGGGGTARLARAGGRRAGRGRRAGLGRVAGGAPARAVPLPPRGAGADVDPPGREMGDVENPDDLRTADGADAAGAKRPAGGTHHLAGDGAAGRRAQQRA